MGYCWHLRVFREDKYFNKGFYVGLGIILGSIVLQTFVFGVEN